MTIHNIIAVGERMTVPQSELDPYALQLISETSRQRESAAEQLADYLQYSELAHSSRLAVGRWLLDALWLEKDEVVIESLLFALGWISFKSECPQLEWVRLALYLPKMPPILLGEYGVATLGESADPSMIPYIKPYLKHSDPYVRQEAETAIATLKQLG